MTNTKKSIAFVISNLRSGGAERVVATLANYFADKYHVHIIKKTNAAPFYELNSKIKVHALVDKEKGSSNVIFAVLSNIKLVQRIKQISTENSIDILIGFTTTSSVLSIFAAKSLKIPCIISERNNPVAVPPNAMWSFLRNSYYKNANALVVQTKANASFFSKYISKEKIKVIVNPIAQELIEKRAELEPSEEKIILNVGRLNANKAQDVLIKAFEQLNHPDYKLVLIGNGPKKEQYQALTKDLNLSNKVIFTDSIDNVYDYYLKASIFAFTSRSEGMPNALMEAMYFGLPCVSTDCPNGPSDLIKNHENGILVPVDDQEALTKNMDLLIQNKHMRATLGAKAKKTAIHFELDTIALEWEKLISSSLNTN